MEKTKNDSSENIKDTQPVQVQPVENAKKARPKSAIGRWLDRLAKTNQKEFGSNGPTCCN